ALKYAIGAGDRATAALAYEDAVRQYGRALGLLDASVEPDPWRRCEVLIALGNAQANAGDRDGGRTSFARAAEIARWLGATERGVPGEAERAAELAASAVAAVQRLGREAPPAAGVAGPTPQPSAGRDHSVDTRRTPTRVQGTFRAEGDYWLVVYDGATCRL